MRMQRKHHPANQVGGALLDPAHDRIAVLHREWERAAHERRAHPFVLARRNAPGENQPLRAAADRAEEGPHAHLPRTWAARRLVANFGAARRGIPEPTRRLLTRGAAVTPPGWALHSAQRDI